MPRITLTEGFLDALSALDPADMKRTARFLEKLAHTPEASSLRPRIMHDAADRTVRAFRVTHDLRAIARISGDEIRLLHVARHDRAYVWVRNACTDCATDMNDLLAVPGEPLYVCATTRDLCVLLGERGLEHGLDD